MLSTCPLGLIIPHHLGSNISKSSTEHYFDDFSKIWSELQRQRINPNKQVFLNTSPFQFIQGYRYTRNFIFFTNFLIFRSPKLKIFTLGPKYYHNRMQEKSLLAFHPHIFIRIGTHPCLKNLPFPFLSFLIAKQGICMNIF